MPKSRSPDLAPARPPTLRQQRFVHEYLVDGNAAAAARRAGFEQRRSKSYGCQLLQKPAVKAAIAAERAARAAPWTRQAAVEALRKIACANVLDYVRAGPDGALELDLWRLERDPAGAVKGLTVTERTDPKTGAVTRTVGFALADRSAALARLASMLEADEAAAALARGRGDGIAAVAALSVEAFGRFKEALAWAGRKRGAAAVLEDVLAGERAARPTAEKARAEAALAAREEALEAEAERLEKERDGIWRERQAMVAQAQRLVRLREEVEGERQRR